MLVVQYDNTAPYTVSMCVVCVFANVEHFCEILMTKCIKRIRDLFEYALYKFTLYFTCSLYYCVDCSDYLALNVYVALCYYKLDYYDVSQVGRNSAASIQCSVN